MVIRAKICGITRMEDAEFAIENGADAVGFVFEPASPRCVLGREDLLNAIPKLAAFATTVSVHGVLGEDLGPCDRVQYVYSKIQPPHPLPVLRLPPGTFLEEALKRAQALPSGSLVLDAYDPDAYGGTGKRADWSLAAALVRETEKKVVLAGGLDPSNIAEALLMVRPYAVDVSSGVESSAGIKDRAKVRDFLQTVKA